MFKVYTETITDDIVMFKNGKIEDNLEEVESILDAVLKATGKPIWKWTDSFVGIPGKIVIELNLNDENVEKIEKLIELKKKKLKKTKTKERF